MEATNLQKIGTLILILLCFLSQLKAQEIGTYHNLTEALQNPTDVRILDLSNKRLKTLPKEIGELQNLTVFNLYVNQLKTLPKEIGKLKNLTVLDLTNNQLTTLPKEIGKLQSLRELDLSGNQLTTLPKDIGKLQNLQELYLDDIPAWRSQEEKIRKLLPQTRIIFNQFGDAE
ncbi:leucine-rich repeat domain-containing protein [Leptospira borgpetersenii]|uniref:leucine-rich repeat domain-containing protein n=1 Tax=Leptospira borgpetersenii TaxID=174 RepID=UPI0020217557|nr:leucine-rich repeat domain-containing protein [Leptospira borgpetersenii]URD70712.1 leucine-rich repeat domain-containing protein [Leptospira borgpetersenii]UVD73890.1 leucine-rich repeat domain-containing protein [Leptospira borgpetersenii]UVD77083.1 leucine-rich repeat domain-containing protein [Leptospira borgpetersenii]UZW33647.1 leucine-rich repeat domain-containing protein [Leptospira borgpetersenii]